MSAETAGAAAPAALEAHGLARAYGGRTVLEGVTLRAEPGDVVAVIGPNGSGKTTLLRLLAGVLRPTRGEVVIAGERLAGLTPRQRALRLGYLPQVHEVPQGFRARDLVEMGRHPHLGESPASREAAVREALAAVGAGPLSERRLETLSGGELQRVFLASVVAQGAPVLLLDEPTVFLDPGRALEVQAVLCGLAREGRTLVVATHDLEFVRRSAARVLALRDGRIAWQTTSRAALDPTRLGQLFRMTAGLEAAMPAWTDATLGMAGAPAVPGASRQQVARTPTGPEPRSRKAGAIVVLACALVLAGAPFVGPSLAEAGVPESTATFILWQLRVPRVLLAALVGGALALAGAAFQALFRNPLATPYTLGVASGASAGAVATVLLGVGGSVAGLTATSLGALVGALAITAAVYGLGRRRSGLPTATLLLAGVTLGFFFSALILLLQYFADFTEAFRILRWLMGEVRIVGYRTLLVVGPLALAGVGLVLARGAELNLLLTGEELAAARGVDVERAKRVVFLGTSLAVGAVVSACGPIGFVGLIVPHAARAFLGPDLRRLAPACVPAGAAFLVLCDTVARLALAPAELPVGVVTSLVGGPVFLAVLLRHRAA